MARKSAGVEAQVVSGDEVELEARRLGGGEVEAEFALGGCHAGEGGDGAGRAAARGEPGRGESGEKW